MTSIKIYTTTTCPFCKMLKEYLDGRNISYENIFVDEDTEAAAELMKLEGQMGVPFTIITKEDGSRETVLGFDKDKINEILGIS